MVLTTCSQPHPATTGTSFHQEWQNLPQNRIRRLTGTCSMRRKVEAIIRHMAVTHIIKNLATKYHFTTRNPGCD
jgi:hypothetical protein